MIIRSSKDETRLSKNMKALGPSYPSSAPNHRIIGWWIYKLPRYYISRFPQAYGFSGKDELISRGLKTLTSLNLINILSLERVKSHKKSRINS